VRGKLKFREYGCEGFGFGLAGFGVGGEGFQGVQGVQGGIKSPRFESLFKPSRSQVLNPFDTKCIEWEV